LYKDYDILNLFCLDNNGNTLIEKNDLIKNKEKIEIIRLNFGSASHGKILYIYTEEKHSGKINRYYNLRSFDENFNFFAEIKLDKGPNCYIRVNGENLFLLNKNEKFSTISMYNPELEVIQTFGQENSTLPYFFPLKIDMFLASNQYFIINEFYEEDEDYNDHNKVTIINLLNGLVESSFKIHDLFDQMRLYLDKFLITFNNETCLLQCYNFKGDLLHQIILSKSLKRSEIHVINKELCFNLNNFNFLIF
jgi:hypothetical protein